jgi:hypothetical protein
VPSIVRPHPWRALEACGSCGVELWSLLTDVAERWRTPRQVLRFIRDPLASLDGPPIEHLARWDRLCASRRVPAIGGLDAHQTGLRVGRVVISPMPHERYFSLLRTRVLLHEPPSRDISLDRDAVYDALRAGRCYLALDGIAPARGFQFSARGDGRLAWMGSEVRAGRWSLSASLAQPAMLRLIRDGRAVAERRGMRLEHSVEEPGVYRVEARLSVGGRSRLWIVSNPIYIR